MVSELIIEPQTSQKEARFLTSTQRNTVQSYKEMTISEGYTPGIYFPRSLFGVGWQGKRYFCDEFDIMERKWSWCILDNFPALVW
jgi:hypothetical protein